MGNEAENLPRAIMETRLEKIELGLRQTEVVLVKNMADLQTAIRDSVQRQENAHRVLAEATQRLTDVIEKSFREVLETALGRDQYPAKEVRSLSRSYNLIIAGLIFALIFALTGIQLKFLPNFHEQAYYQVQNNTAVIEEMRKIISEELKRDVPSPKPPAPEPSPAPK